MTRWFRFRWWLARLVAPRGVLPLLVKAPDWSHAVELHGGARRAWGSGWRYVTPEMARAMHLVIHHPIDDRRGYDVHPNDDFDGSATGGFAP